MYNCLLQYLRKAGDLGHGLPAPDRTIEIKTRGTTMSRKAINREPTGERRIIQLHSDMTEAPSLPAVCERIRFYRKKKGMEQKQLANLRPTDSNEVEIDLLDLLGARADAVVLLEAVV